MLVDNSWSSVWLLRNNGGTVDLLNNERDRIRRQHALYTSSCLCHEARKENAGAPVIVPYPVTDSSNKHWA